MTMATTTDSTRVRAMAASLPKHAQVRLGTVRLGVLLKSPGNKRPTDKRKQERIAADVDPLRLEAITVSERDGRLWVIEGWTRVGGLRLAGWTEANAVIISGLSVSDESRLCREINDGRTQYPTLARFWNRVDEGDDIAHGVIAACASLGISVAGADTSAIRVYESGSSTKAVDALYNMASAHGVKALTEGLSIIRTAWPDHGNALDATTIKYVVGFHALYRKHPAYSQERLASVLAKSSPIALHAGVKEVQRLFATTPGHFGSKASLAIVLGHYNKGLRTAKLPEAEQSHIKRATLGQNPWASK